MKPIDAAAHLHNAISTTTAAYGAHLQEVNEELAAAHATIAELKRLHESYAKETKAIASEDDVPDDAVDEKEQEAAS